jgi:hypothetical protein
MKERKLINRLFGEKPEINCSFMELKIYKIQEKLTIPKWFFHTPFQELLKIVKNFSKLN